MMRKLAIVLIHTGLLFGLTGACSSDDETEFGPNGGAGSGGRAGSAGTGGKAGSTSQGGTGDQGGAGGEPSSAGAGGDTTSAGAGGAAGGGGVGGDHQHGGAPAAGAGGAPELGGAGGTPAGGAAGAGGGTGPSCLPDNTTLDVVNQGTSNYLIDGDADPTLTLCRGNTYTFAVDAMNHDFWIKTVAGNGTSNAYNDGVTNNGDDIGNVVFTVPAGAPDTLFYSCVLHSAMSGTLQIVD